MLLTIPASPSSGKERYARIWFIGIAVFLSLCVLADLILIFFMSSEDPQASGDRSNEITDTVVDVVYPDINQRPADEQTNIFTSVHHFVRKLAHFTEFALLGLFSTLLLGHLARRLTALRLGLRLALTAGFSLLYAISDEVHQIFTNRGPSVIDVLIDFSGALFGILAGHLFICLIRVIRRAIAARSTKREVAAS